MTLSSAPSPLRLAIDLTLKTIERRSFHFRNTIIAVAVIIVCAIAASLFLRSWRPLASFFLLPTFVVCFIMIDTIIVGSWRKYITRNWASGELDLDVFMQTVGMMKSLPAATIAGMLELLPRGCSTISREPPALRSTIGETDCTIMTVQIIRTILTVSIGVVVPVSLGAALLMLSLFPLTGISALLLVLTGTLLLEWNAWRRWRNRVTLQMDDHSLNRDEFIEAASLLTWGRKDNTLKKRLLYSIGTS